MLLPRVAQLLLEGQPGAAVEVAGWVRTRRDNKGGFSFIELNDGSCMANLQIVVDSSVPGYAETIKLVTTGASIRVSGELKASPGAKQRAAALIDAAGGVYVEAAVMTSIPPYRIKVPLLLGGAKAAALAPLLAALGFDAKVASDRLGVASATKMCRSVMIKGLEAMVIECFTAARAYGVEDAVLASLKETLPGIDWEQQGAYYFQRVIEHGRRRCEEVREVAETVREIGLTPWSAQGTAERQAWVADLADAGVFGPKGTPGFARSSDWRVEADRLLAHVKKD